MRAKPAAEEELPSLPFPPPGDPGEDKAAAVAVPGDAMTDEPIPLYDGEPSGAKIVHSTYERLSPADTQTAQSRRGSARRPQEGVFVCLTVEYKNGKVEHVECPVINMSASGVAVEFDQKVELGVTGAIQYSTISHQPVRTCCSITRCQPLDNGRFLLALKLNKPLSVEERRPAKLRPGRQLVSGLHSRKLRELQPQPGGEAAVSQQPFPGLHPAPLPQIMPEPLPQTPLTPSPQAVSEPPLEFAQEPSPPPSGEPSREPSFNF
jgi:hypothetical protein